MVSALDRKIQETAPFKLVKTDPEAGKKVIAKLVEDLRGIAFLLRPFMPATAESIERAIKANKMPPSLFSRKD